MIESSNFDSRLSQEGVPRKLRAKSTSQTRRTEPPTDFIKPLGRQTDVFSQNLLTSSDAGNIDLLLSDEERYLCGLVGTVGNYDELRDYLDSTNIDITCIVDGSGYTLLHLAVYQNSLKITRLLCDYVR